MPYIFDDSEIPSNTTSTIDSQNNNSNGIEGKTIEKDVFDKNAVNSAYNLLSNKLHQYASYTYLFTLSCLNRDDLDFPTRITTQPAHDIVARSAGIGPGGEFSDFDSQFNVAKKKYNQAKDKTSTGRTLTQATDEAVTKLKQTLGGANEILRQNKDIFFERVEIDSKATINAERKLMNFTKIRFTLSEPLGITLFEKLRAGAGNCGFIDHVEAPFLLTLEFKGYDSKGNIVPGPPKRYFPIRITKASMKLDAGGTIYEMTAQPWTEFAMVNTFLYTKTHGEAKAFGGELSAILKSLANALNDNEQKITSAGYSNIPNKYVITYDKRIIEGGWESSSPFDNNNSKNYATIPNQFKSVGWKDRESIAKLIESIILQMPKYKDISKIQKDYWNKVQAATAYDDPNAELPSEYVPWFKIVTNVTINPDWDDYLKTHSKVIHFHIQPYGIHIANFARAGLAGNPGWGNWVRKRYDYIYTGQNFDITNLEIEYNVAFFQAKLINSTKAENVAINTSLSAKILSFLGIKSYPEANLPLKQYPARSRYSNPGANEQEDQSAVQEFYDYITNPLGDMVNIDMEILGDPDFIGHDFAIPLQPPLSSGQYTFEKMGGRSSYDPNLGAFNFDNAQVVIQLNFRFPSDFDENTGLHNFSTDLHPMFSGLYRINSVVSVFDRGTFKQTLQMSRFNNQDPSSTNKLNRKNIDLGQSKQQDVYEDYDDAIWSDPHA